MSLANEESHVMSSARDLSTATLRKWTLQLNLDIADADADADADAGKGLELFSGTLVEFGGISMALLISRWSREFFPNILQEHDMEYYN